jgi:hypothetical protein
MYRYLKSTKNQWILLRSVTEESANNQLIIKATAKYPIALSISLIMEFFIGHFSCISGHTDIIGINYPLHWELDKEMNLEWFVNVIF